MIVGAFCNDMSSLLTKHTTNRNLRIVATIALALSPVSCFSSSPHYNSNYKGPFLTTSTAPIFAIHRGGSSTTLHSTTTSTTTTNMDEPLLSDNESSDWKLDKLRAKMAEVGVDAYIVPSDDPHLSEYVPAAYARRGFLSNFNGSAGTALVTADKAYMWTDSRYVSPKNLHKNLFIIYLLFTMYQIYIYEYICVMNMC